MRYIGKSKQCWDVPVYCKLQCVGLTLGALFIRPLKRCILGVQYSPHLMDSLPCYGRKWGWCIINSPLSAASPNPPKPKPGTSPNSQGSPSLGIILVFKYHYLAMCVRTLDTSNLGPHRTGNVSVISGSIQLRIFKKKHI